MLRFRVFTKARAPMGVVQVAGPGHPSLIGARAVLRHNALSDAEFTVDADHHLVPVLATPGARVVVEYRPQGGEWRREFSGPVKARKGEGHPATRSFTVGDDKAVLWNLTGWPRPSKPAGGQTDTHWKLTGKAESVFKRIVGENKGRHFQPITVAPDLGRGGQITVASRFDKLSDLLPPLLDEAGLGVSVIQAEDNSGLVVDVYPKRKHSTALSDRSGVIVGDTSYADANPTVTRVIVGAGGEGTARVFAQYVDTAREAEWGDTIEVFRDARDITPGELVVDGSFADGFRHWTRSGTVALQGAEGEQYARITGSGTLTQVPAADVGPRTIIEFQVRVRTTATAGTGGFRLVNPDTGVDAFGTWEVDSNNGNILPGDPAPEFTTRTGIFRTANVTQRVQPRLTFSGLNAPVDVTDFKVTGGSWIYEPLLRARADETFAEGAPTASLRLELAETEHFRYGNAVLLGDIVTASVAGGPPLSDTVREVEISQDNDGVNVTPRVGDRASDPDNPDAQLARAVAAALKGVRHLNTRR